MNNDINGLVPYKDHEQPSSQDIDFYTRNDTKELRTGKLIQAVRHEIYSRMGLRVGAITDLEDMVAGAPARKVGNGAIHNVKGMFYSKLNEAHRLTESHTCEGVFALQLELDPEVIGYYTQVRCPGISRYTSSGKKHVSSATIDFLVYKKDSIHLVECKYRSAIENKYEKDNNTDWILENNVWRHGPYEAWANSRGIAFNVWVQDTPFAIEQQNLNAIYALKDTELTSVERTAADKSLAIISKAPSTIQMLGEEIKNFSPRIALWLMANSNVYGLLRSVSINNESLFYLYADKEQAFEIDHSKYAHILDELKQPEDLDPLLVASGTDFRNAKRRLALLMKIKAGEAPKSVRMTRLQKKVDEAVSLGYSALSACLTKYSNCGTNARTLSPSQFLMMKKCIKEFWHKENSAITIRDLHFHLIDMCRDADIETPGYSTLCGYIRTLSPTSRALAIGGVRAYQSERPRTDATRRSGPALGYGYHLIIDSSQFDQRCVTHTLEKFSTAKPTFYIGVDSASGEIMAYSMYLGMASIAGLAMLLRDFQRRHGCLPSVIQVDRGSEYESIWIREFCEFYGITLLHAPTGGSRFNSQAENSIKMINFQLAHKGPGSTAPDMAGRKVDGKYKSMNTVRHELYILHNMLDEFIRSSINVKPNNQYLSPSDLKNEYVSKYGILGISCKYDDSFIINTSIKMNSPKKAKEHDGIRTTYGRYTSDDLQLALRSQSPSEIRRDCADPSRIYVKIGCKWYTAFNQSILSFVGMPDFDKFFASMTWPLLKALAEKQKIENQHMSYQQLQVSNKSTSDNYSVIRNYGTGADDELTGMRSGSAANSDLIEVNDEGEFDYETIWHDIFPEVIINAN